jgi:hypothetical protein
MDFNNARLTYRNFSFGPDAGRIYHIDHTTDTMFVKNSPGGDLETPVALVNSIPLSTNLVNEVRSLEYDGYYFWTLTAMGSSESLGIRIEKWELSSTGNTLVKKYGLGNEFTLINSYSQNYDSEAFGVHTISKNMTAPVASGAITIPVADFVYIEVGDEIYLGPNLLADREAHTVQSFSGSSLVLDDPLEHSYNSTDDLKIRKNLWVFNNYHLTDTKYGQLIQLDTYDGSTVSTYVSTEWRDVTAAAGYAGDICYVRDAQYLEYRPFGTNPGYQKSLLLENIKNDHNTIIKVHDLAIDDDALHKLQTAVHYYDTSVKQFLDIDSTDDLYNVEKEFFAGRVKSLAFIREDRSVLFGEAVEARFTVALRSQEFVPVAGRAVTINEDNTTGFIKPGYESFTTNTQGEGETIYNSGATPDFALPTITAEDVVTGLRGLCPLVQSSSIDNISFIEQLSARRGITRVKQEKQQFQFPIKQNLMLESIKHIEQVGAIDSLVQVDQNRVDNVLPIKQFLTVDSLPVDQIPSTSALTILNQYVFLLFAIPAPFSKKNDPYTDILVRIAGFGTLELVPETLKFYVNRLNVADSVNVGAFAGGLELTYDPAGFFPYGSRVHIEIEIQDNDDPPNTINTNYYFDIVGDYKKPFIDDMYPPPESIDNGAYTQVCATINDLETGIDLDSIQMYIEGRLVEHNVLDNTDEYVKICYSTTCAYAYKARITASVFAADNTGNKIVETWSFYITDSPGVLYISNVPIDCQVMVPVDIELCSEVFGLEEGVNINTLEVNLNNKDVRYVLKPKVYRKE